MNLIQVESGKSNTVYFCISKTGIIHLVSMHNFSKSYHFLPPDIHTCVYHAIEN